MSVSVRKYYWIPLLFLALVGLIVDLYVTRGGAGITGDGVWYLDGAQNLLQGHGYSILRGDSYLPINEFPPFYSIVLAGLGLLGGPIYATGRILGAVLLGVNIFLAGWIVFRVTRTAFWGIASSALVLLSNSILSAHSWILTEALYITLTLVCLVCLLMCLEKRRFLWVVLAGAVAGLAIVTRYVGVALLALCCLSLLFFETESWKRRLADAILTGWIGLLPVGIWFLRNSWRGQALTGRSGIAMRMLPAANFVTAFVTVWDWFFPDTTALTKLPRLVLLIVTLGLLLGIPLFFVLFKPQQIKPLPHPRFNQFLLVLALSTLVYLAVLGFSLSLSLVGSPFSAEGTQIARFLIPAFVVVAIWTCLGLFLWSRLLQGHWVWRLLPVLVSIYLLVFSAINFEAFRKPLYMGYADLKRDQPGLVAALAAVDPARAIVTNDFERIYFLAGRPVYSLPGYTNELTGIPNPQYQDLMKPIADLVNGGALVVIQRSTPDQKFLFDPMLAGLRSLGTYGQITLYGK